MAAVHTSPMSDDEMDDVPLALLASRAGKPVASSASDRPSRLSSKSRSKARPRPELEGNGAGPTRKKAKTRRNSSPSAVDRDVGSSAPNGANGHTNGRRRRSSSVGDDEDDDEGGRWWDSNNDANGGNDGKKWDTLVHHGVVFPPAYEPHGVPMLYDGKPVKLDARAEEVATFYAQKVNTDYVKKEKFNENFFEDFRAVLKGSDAYKVVKKLSKCDFSRIVEMLEKAKEEKKNMPSDEKKRKKEEEKQRMEKYTMAIVDGRDEKIGNFRVEPPGLFLGRGEHPKMGRVKKRILPEDITINIGPEADVPECLPGHKWRNVVHKKDVTWLAGWKDSITGGHKYVWLSAGSTFKGMSDQSKFDKAKKLKKFIGKIRRDYKDGWKSDDLEKRQQAVAMYLIDKLALRAGNEKGDDEADTVGCCSLRVEHIKFPSENVIELDFLGKDSIRYLNEVTVEPMVFKNLKLFCRKKKEGESIFDRLTVTKVNDYCKSIMPGLSAKVFRTYNASITLAGLLAETPPDASLNDKVVFYNQQNKEVAILCNHQRAMPKAHGTQMEKLNKKKEDYNVWIAELKRGLKKAKKVDGKVTLTQMVPVKPEYTDDMKDEERAAERKRAAEEPKVAKEVSRSQEQIEAALDKAQKSLDKLEADMTVKEELKTVALGTSKINYLDPRITVAWCKKFDVPIEKIFAKTLLTKFAWAMETEEAYKF